ncbi:MAG: YdeI/OmpD-associated family protein [Gemmatimonadetes bacterium]|nr:YdeI/OmpD-associated family protein [Gemmatimonadota bacterium]
MTAPKVPGPTHFPTAGAFRTWLATHHSEKSELIVGFYKKDSGRGGITYAEALDEALCHGWIDGVRRAVDAASFSVRFTPRRPKSYWSRVNRAKVELLLAAGRMTPAGLAAWERRDAVPPDQYSFERTPQRLPQAMERAFRKDAAAWAWFSSRVAGYQRLAVHWVVSAKQEATRARRLATLISSSAAGQPMPGYLAGTPGAARDTTRAGQEKATGRSPRPAAPPHPTTKARPR